MAEVRWSLDARADLESIVIYIARYSTLYATAVASRTESAVRRLEDYPHSGRIVPEYGEESLREVIVEGYRASTPSNEGVWKS